VEVVISGLSGRLPESDNIAEFREHLINGDDMVTEDDRRWEPGEPEIIFDIYYENHRKSVNGSSSPVLTARPLSYRPMGVSVTRVFPQPTWRWER